jgi:hypothetical protein
MASPKRPRSGDSPFTPTLPLITPQLPVVRDRRGNRPDSMAKLLERIQRGDKERRSHRERRATPRVAVALDLEAVGDGEALLRTTHDLSTFGLAIRGGPTMRTGATLALRLFLPDAPDEPLQLTAVVVGAFDAAGGVRMRFVDPPLEAVRRIHRLVAPLR